jgi:hypothetical protein
MKPWQQLQPAKLIPKTEEEHRAMVADLTGRGFTEEQVRTQIAQVQEDEIWLNNLYQVHLRRIANPDPEGPPLVHLSIRRRDRKAARDWRDFQRIKNQLVGAECEAVELYPAESRLVDSANQFHLWAVADPTFRFPIGFGGGRFVVDEDGPMPGGGQQRGRT